MKKQILELLRELQKLTPYEICIICNYKFEGYINEGYSRFILKFSSESELIQGLKDKIKELKNK